MCVTIPAQLVEYVDDGRHFAWVEQTGVRRKVNTSLLRGEDSAEPGDYVLVHVEMAISKVSAEEAADTLRFMELLGGGSDSEFEIDADGKFQIDADDEFEIELPAVAEVR
jgi:hydrogenase expression/formation protein HypC